MINAYIGGLLVENFIVQGVIIHGCKYTINKKQCDSFEEGENDKALRRKDGSNRKGRCW